jgi:hypothetical protein
VPGLAYEGAPHLVGNPFSLTHDIALSASHPRAPLFGTRWSGAPGGARRGPNPKLPDYRITKITNCPVPHPRAAFFGAAVGVARSPRFAAEQTRNYPIIASPKLQIVRCPTLAPRFSALGWERKNMADPSIEPA